VWHLHAVDGSMKDAGGETDKGRKNKRSLTAAKKEEEEEATIKRTRTRKGDIRISKLEAILKPYQKRFPVFQSKCSAAETKCLHYPFLFFFFRFLIFAFIKPERSRRKFVKMFFS
jgi:hypothetical protein